MFRFGLFVIGSLAALFLILAPPPATAQMKMEGGHGASHNKEKKPAAHGHAEKTAPHGHAEKPAASGHGGHTGHKPANAHGAHQASVRPTKIPEHLDVATTKFSEQAKFSVNVTSRIDPIAINKMHSWVIQIKNPDGKPIHNAKLNISGGMPMHGHGLPTAPRVTKNLGDGKYLVEGVRFNMAGWWEMKVSIDGGHHKDNVTFNLVLK
ncbi:MAG: FixH family protein [Rhodospirillales bacterium]|jgi:hypothetical protein|nr:FixH family protein [Rhodospirillales bacterium]